MDRLREVQEEFAALHPAGSDDPDVRLYEMLPGFYAVAPPDTSDSSDTRRPLIVRMPRSRDPPSRRLPAAPPSVALALPANASMSGPGPADRGEGDRRADRRRHRARALGDAERRYLPAKEA